MKTADLIKHFGGDKQVMALFEISRQGLDLWKKAGVVPRNRQAIAELLSEGKFKYPRSAAQREYLVAIQKASMKVRAAAKVKAK